MKNRSTSGFTLLETLIALGLVTTLMVLCWSLLATFSRLETRSRKIVSGLEMTRTLSRQLRDDLDQLSKVQFGRSTNSKGSESSSELTGFSGEMIADGPVFSLRNKIESNSEDSAESYLLDAPLFEGDSSSLTLLVPNEIFSASNEGSDLEDAKVSNWSVVTYQWQPESSLNLDRESAETQVNPSVNREEALNQESPGMRVFARRKMSYAAYRIQSQTERNSFLETTRDEPLETITIGRPSGEANQTDAESPQIVDEMPEISEISFRYFDGKSWLSSFSAASGSYPIAVEVIFKIKKKGEESRDDKQQESELDFGDEIEIGFEPEGESFSANEFDSELGGNINPDFDSDSHRVLIYIGPELSERKPLAGRGLESLDFEFSGEIK